MKFELSFFLSNSALLWCWKNVIDRVVSSTRDLCISIWCSCNLFISICMEKKMKYLYYYHVKGWWVKWICLKTGQIIPFRIFLSGAAGVGKSTIIKAVYQLTSYHFDNIRGENPDSVKTMLTAFSGKAASIINGTTIHSTFALQVNQWWFTSTIKWHC